MQSTLTRENNYEHHFESQYFLLQAGPLQSTTSTPNTTRRSESRALLSASTDLTSMKARDCATRPRSGSKDDDVCSIISGISECMTDHEPLDLRTNTSKSKDTPMPLKSEVKLQPNPSEVKPRARRINPLSITPGSIEVTKASLENPRSVLSLPELELILIQRDLPHRPAHEDHARVVARLHEIDNNLSGRQLNALLREAFLPTSFPNDDKIRLLQKHDADSSKNGQCGVKSTDLKFKQSYEAYDVYNIDR